ncbi:MAG: hypothetical protein RBU27_08710 [Bacteroidota bacterium]|jgi:hypothetical protein|nr:hypothetical protein [Bacteroidota bacterium]
MDHSPFPLRIVPIIAIALLVSGCADSIVSDDDPRDQPVRASFHDIQQRVFNVSCAVPGCHAGDEPASGLDLTADRAYAGLVGVPSWNHPTMKRVEPGSSTGSTLIGQLRRQLVPAMPPNGSLPSAVVDSIAAWIEAGALNN